MRNTFFPIVALLFITATASAQTNYEWKIGVYNAPQFYNFEQKESILGTAKGSAFIFENIQITVQKKIKHWVLDSAVNYSILNLDAPDTDETVNLFSYFLGGIYKQQWIMNVQYEQVPIVNSSRTVRDFSSLNTTWLSVGYQRKVFHPRIQIFGIASLPVLISSTMDTLDSSSGYKFQLGSDYRMRFKSSWDFYVRPFMEYKHWDLNFDDVSGKTKLTLIQYGLRFGLNKFF